ncbi:DNA cytosine methyltransferase [Corynebacterium sp. S7]
MGKTAVDLFAGVGGLSEGFRQAGFNVLLANEWDKSIAQSYTHNHPHTRMIVDDITNLPIPKTFRSLRDKTEIVFGGPPCQGFSQKGSRKTIQDERNYLFKYFVKVVEYLHPQYFVMENVPNLLTSENGLFKNEISEMFQEIGYSVNAGVLNASDFGVPQNRRRAIIIGTLDNRAIELPKILTEKIPLWDAISDLAYLNSGEGTEISEYLNEPTTQYQREARLDSDRLFNHRATNHSKIALERLAMIPPLGGRDFLPPEHRTKSIYSGTWSRMDPQAQAVTITTRFDTPSSGRFTHPFLDRAITVREAARIQSFPDTYQFIGTKTSQMKQVGNAVPPKLGFAIANQILSTSKENLHAISVTS